MTAVTTLALIGEDTAHAVLLGALTRASIAEVARASRRAWIADNLASDPEFVGEIDLTGVLPGLQYTSSIRGLAEDAPAPRIGARPIKLRGHLGGQTLAPEAQKWRYLLVAVLAREPDAVLVAKDTDGDPSSLDGLRQVAECWLVAGCAGKTRADAAETVRRELRFDPVQHPERLTAHPNDAPTDAKSAPLTPEEFVEHGEALLGDLDALRQPRCGSTGVVAFLAALRERVVPMVVPRA